MVSGSAYFIDYNEVFNVLISRICWLRVVNRKPINFIQEYGGIKFLVEVYLILVQRFYVLYVKKEILFLKQLPS